MDFKYIKLMFITVVSLFAMNISFAQDSEGMLNSMGMYSQEIDEYDISTQVPVGEVVTLGDADKYVKEKGYQLILFIQSIAKPITLVVMVICGLMAIVSGLFGGREGGSGKWILSALISGICYGLVVAAPMLLEMLIGFLNIN